MSRPLGKKLKLKRRTITNFIKLNEKRVLKGGRYKKMATPTQGDRPFIFGKNYRRKISKKKISKLIR